MCIPSIICQKNKHNFLPEPWQESSFWEKNKKPVSDSEIAVRTTILVCSCHDVLGNPASLAFWICVRIPTPFPEPEVAPITFCLSQLDCFSFSFLCLCLNSVSFSFHFLIHRDELGICHWTLARYLVSKFSDYFPESPLSESWSYKMSTWKPIQNRHSYTVWAADARTFR